MSAAPDSGLSPQRGRLEGSRRPAIFPGDREATWDSGTVAGAGSFRCSACGYRIVLRALDRVPRCPHCLGGRFRRCSTFQDRVDPEPCGHPQEPPGWLSEAGAHASEDRLLFHDGRSVRSAPLGEEWTRIGRSPTADVRLDDPSVSRRHALVHRHPEGIRILDDRSLNGVFVCGQRVIEERELENGDGIRIGRFCLYLQRVTKATGTVMWFSDVDRGFGFITPDEGARDLFAHQAPIPGAGSLAAGMRVSYELEAGANGPKAVNVQAL